MSSKTEKSGSPLNSSSSNDEGSLIRQVNGTLNPNEAMKRALNLSAQSASEQDHRSRTEGKPLCRFFFTPYGCMKGFQCLFRHHEMEIGDDPEESHRVRTAGAPLCRFFGTPLGCQYGYNCAYSHGLRRRTRSMSSLGSTYSISQSIIACRKTCFNKLFFRKQVQKNPTRKI